MRTMDVNMHKGRKGGRERERKKERKREKEIEREREAWVAYTLW